ncbi:MAG: hypothetical protein NT061_09765 [Spirochaetes bacterium]|nr:hypothetical protein [Spirochaetota bacterium]
MVLALFAVLAPGVFAQSAADAYTSASESAMKATLSGNAFEAAAKALASGSSDLASAAKAKVPGYKAPKSFIGNVMSTNPDGSVGISTISQWAYTDFVVGKDILTLQLTYGQNAINLAGVNHRGTLFVPGVPVDGKNMKFFVHFKVVKVDVLPYSDKAFDAGEFNFYYSGKDGMKNQYTLTCEVMGIEEVSGSVKLNVVFP